MSLLLAFKVSFLIWQHFSLYTVRLISLSLLFHNSLEKFWDSQFKVKGILDGGFDLGKVCQKCQGLNHLKLDLDHDEIKAFSLAGGIIRRI